jgi:peptide deformylase
MPLFLFFPHQHNNKTMAILEILTYPNPILRKKTTPITEFGEELKTLVQSMTETMYDAPGVGLAAPQIGLSICLVVIDLSPRDEENQPIVLANPEIIEAEGAVMDEEGCLSLPELNAKVKRAERIKVKAQNIDGEPIEFEAEEWFARVVQHELDHLQGILFLDKISVLKRAMYKKKRKKILAEG